MVKSQPPTYKNHVCRAMQQICCFFFFNNSAVSFYFTTQHHSNSKCNVTHSFLTKNKHSHFPFLALFSRSMVWFRCWIILLVVLGGGSGSGNVLVVGANVSYDGRSLIIDGQRRILFSGSIHYPRSTPDVSIYAFSFSFYYMMISFDYYK